MSVSTLILLLKRGRTVRDPVAGTKHPFSRQYTVFVSSPVSEDEPCTVDVTCWDYFDVLGTPSTDSRMSIKGEGPWTTEVVYQRPRGVEECLDG